MPKDTAISNIVALLNFPFIHSYPNNLKIVNSLIQNIHPQKANMYQKIPLFSQTLTSY